MSLKFNPSSPEIAEIVRTGLSRMGAKEGFSTPRLAQINADRNEPTPDLSNPLPVYNLRLDELAKGHGLEAADQTSWKYQLKYGDEVVASADVVFGSDGKPVFAQVNEGLMVPGTVSAIQAAGVDERIKRGEYVVRLLMVPSLYTAILWLVDTAKEEDLAVPIAPTPPALMPNKVISAKELLSVLHKAAKEALSAQLSDESKGN